MTQRPKLHISRVHDTSERVAVAHLLYEGDKAFVPITPLAVLRESTTFFKARLTGQDGIRAAASYELRLSGCDDGPGTGKVVDVYELASSIVRRPMGGFEEPSLQQLFAFVRLVDILYPYVPRDDSNDDAISVIAAVAANNDVSLGRLTDLGMKPIDPLPRWLEYEHRSWFPRIEARKERRIEKEAHYLWLPPEAARALFQKLAAVADGSKPLSRPALGSPGSIEAYDVSIEFTEFRALVEQFGTFSAAVEHVPFEIFQPPPKFALLETERF